ncbi:site-2 protease family protein [Alkalihalobacillus sp. TS-13]|uniref:site-2 protease family protein n=1 Tax=Alkalihalobacillus sp. TS-13 TaxID=2842455 RepID=UPI001C86E0F1|nr:site-2 protease family protein [Alkalihalobacillus sp. TS-13]
MYIVLLIVFVLFPLATFLHEIGHYLTARLTGLKYSRMQIGIGPTVLHINNQFLHIEYRLFYFIGAHTLSGDIGETSSFNRFLITINGPLINAVTAFFILGFYPMDFSSILDKAISIFAFINIWIALGNLLPYKIKGRKSDGYILLESLWSIITKPRQI